MKQPTFDISIVLSGEAGQGLKTLETVFSKIARANGLYAFTYTESMSRIRGGNNTTEIRVSSNPCNAFVDRIDIAVSFQKDGLRRIRGRIGNDTVIIGESESMDEDFIRHPHACFVALGALAKQSGGVVLINAVAAGMLCAIMCFKQRPGLEILKGNLKRRDPVTLQNNEKAFVLGYTEGERIRSTKAMPCPPKMPPDNTRALLYGSDAVGIGALAGGCNFVSAYPMSPGTSVLEFLAKHSAGFEIVVEQAEDEIAAVNMAVGSWFAGARALVTTAGGGFALMEEAVSLAGCIESPLVIHIGQRPGPATGLPTRTEQGDLNLALYAGHGEFPRVILAPATVEDCIRLTCAAFNLADTYQIPVFVLSDQYLLDSCWSMDRFDLSECKPEYAVQKTETGYKRYALTENPISPRGIPAFGDGFVCVDSDEHDESGHITEDFKMRKNMVDKRNNKLSLIASEAVAPRFEGPNVYKNLLVGWGSTFVALSEALRRSGSADTALLHFSQVYPIHSSAAALLGAAEKRVIVENNKTAQFGAILTQVTGLPFHEKICKYDGMPFSVEFLAESIQKL